MLKQKLPEELHLILSDIYRKCFRYEGCSKPAVRNFDAIVELAKKRLPEYDFNEFEHCGNRLQQLAN